TPLETAPGPESSAAHERIAGEARVVAVRVVDVVVQAAALPALLGALDHELRHRRQVAQLDEVGRQPEVPVVLGDLLLQELDPPARPRETAVAAHDPDVVPHEAADLVPVLRDHDRLVALRGPALLPRRDRAALARKRLQPGDALARRGVREDERL